MPKRPYPFPETFSSQYKIHIGQPELSKYGVFGHTYQQEIYEKTKNLLLLGGKAATGKRWTGGERRTEPQPTGAAVPPVCGQTLLSGQTLIGQDGRLMRGSCAPGEPEQRSTATGQMCLSNNCTSSPSNTRETVSTNILCGLGAPVAPTGCCVCQRSPGSWTVCSQCDRQACSICTRQCSSCSRLCCSVCTTIDYSGPYEEVLCCGCST